MFVFINVCHSAEASAIFLSVLLNLIICLDNAMVRENSSIFNNHHSMNNDTYIGYTIKGRARTLGIEDDCVFHSVTIIIFE